MDRENEPIPRRLNDYRDVGDRVPKGGALSDAWSSYQGVSAPKVGVLGNTGAMPSAMMITRTDSYSLS
jgi:hypothetical protein